MDRDYAVILITTPSDEIADQIARLLLEDKKAACVNIMPGAHSVFWWKGKIETVDERLLIVKTKISLVDEIVSRVKNIHPDEVPEIIALPVIGGNPDYLKWMDDTLY